MFKRKSYKTEYLEILKKYENLLDEKIINERRFKNEIRELKDELNNLNHNVEILTKYKDGNIKLEEDLLDKEREIRKLESELKTNEQFKIKYESEVLKNEGLEKINREIKTNSSLNDKELELELKTLKNNNKVMESEIQYKDKLINQLRELPEIKSMISNLSELAVPNIDKIKELASISNNVVGDLEDRFRKMSEELKNQVKESAVDQSKLVEAIRCSIRGW